MYDSDDTAHTLVEQTCIVTTPRGKDLVFIGFDSRPAGPDTASRVAAFLESCGQRALAYYGDKQTVNLNHVGIIALRSGSVLPDTIQQTVRVHGRVCQVQAKVMRLSSFSIDDMIGQGLTGLLPFYPARYADAGMYPKFETDPRRRRRFIDEIQRILTILEEEDVRTLLTSAYALLSSDAANYPVTKGEIDALFADVLTEDERREVENDLASQDWE